MGGTYAASMPQLDLARVTPAGDDLRMPKFGLPPAMLLDLDDTILDDTGSTERCWRATCESFGTRLGLSPAALFEAVDRQRKWFWADPARHREGRKDLRAAGAHFVGLALESLDVQDPETARSIARHNRDLRDALIAPYPGVIQTLRELCDLGVRLALLTNGAAEPQRAKIERFKLGQYFALVHIEGEHGYGKPEERVYRRAFEHLGVRPSDSWMIGDNLEWDVTTPQSLGVFGVWVDRSRLGVPDSHTGPAPDRIISALPEILEEVAHP